MHHSSQATLDELLSAAKSGEQSAFEALLERYAPLIDSMVSSHSPTPSDEEDLRQEASIAFCRAVERFDLSQKSVSFGLYAKICIRNHLITCTRRPLHDSVAVLDGNEASDADDPAQSFLAEESYLTLYRQIEQLLSSYESRIWWLYLSGRTAREIAAHLSRDERSVQNAIYRIRKKLRTSLPSP